jgi:hypothetical protein
MNRISALKRLFASKRVAQLASKRAAQTNEQPKQKITAQKQSMSLQLSEDLLTDPHKLKSSVGCS